MLSRRHLRSETTFRDETNYLAFWKLEKKQTIDDGENANNDAKSWVHVLKSSRFYSMSSNFLGSDSNLKPNSAFNLSLNSKPKP